MLKKQRNIPGWCMEIQSSGSNRRMCLGIEIHPKVLITLSGLIFQKLGVIPEDGTQNIELEMQGMQIHITCIREPPDRGNGHKNLIR